MFLFYFILLFIFFFCTTPSEEIRFFSQLPMAPFDLAICSYLMGVHPLFRNRSRVLWREAAELGQIQTGRGEKRKIKDVGK
jgi:hypothetical protein